MRSVRLRFAPSPTGPLHIGGVRTALYNYLFAKKSKGKFILRIEDTDQNRYVPGAEKYIIDSLSWCGIEFDEGPEIGGEFGPYRQSERKKIYEKYAQQLVDEGKAYYAFDTPDELEQMRKNMKLSGVKSPQYNSITRNSMKNSLTLSKDEVKKRITSSEKYVIRIKVPRNEEIKLNDTIRGWVSINSNNLDDKVIFKSDGMPTYHLANVVDDYLMKISHVVRGEEWLPSAPLHILLYNYLGWEKEIPVFSHLPLILKPEGNGKLSKRDGERLGFPVFPILWENLTTGEKYDGYKEFGFLAESFINMLVFLGWNPGHEKEIFDLEELVQAFSLERIGKSGAKFDFEKAKWFNQKYVRKLPKDLVVKEISDYLAKNNLEFTNDYIEKVCDLFLERVVFIKDFWIEGKYFFEDINGYTFSLVQKRIKENSFDHMQTLCEKLKKIENFSSVNVESVFAEVLEEFNLKMSMLLPLFRFALTNLLYGPSLYSIAEIIGKKKTINRIENFLKEIS